MEWEHPEGTGSCAELRAGQVLQQPCPIHSWLCWAIHRPSQPALDTSLHCQGIFSPSPLTLSCLELSVTALCPPSLPHLCPITPSVPPKHLFPSPPARHLAQRHLGKLQPALRTELPPSGSSQVRAVLGLQRRERGEGI